MIYISYQINRTKHLLDETIIEVNENIYPKEIAEHMIHLSRQFRELQNSTSARDDSVFVNASHAMILQAFKEVFNDKYFFNDTLFRAQSSRSHLYELENLIANQSSTEPIMGLWNAIKQDNQRLFDELENPVQVLCNYTNGNDPELDTLIIEGLDLVHQQLDKIINSIDDHFLAHMVPFEDSILIDRTLQDQIRSYLRLVINLLLAFIVIGGSIPVLFFILGIVSHRCRSRKHRYSNTDTYRNRNRWEATFHSPSNIYIGNNRSRRILCCTRILLTPIILITTIIILMSGIFYGMDLLDQGICRTVHDDQTFLVPFLIGK